jgi:ankyrin repeat protein
MVTLKAHLRLYHQTYFSDIDTQTRGHSSLSNCPPLGTPDLTNLLFDTISTGNVSMVKGVLELGVDLNCGTFNNNGESFLHYTLRAGHKDIFQLLLEKGASANTMTSAGIAALILAIQNDQSESVRLLLEKGADVESKDSDGNPALFSAIEKSPDMVKLLLEKGASANIISINTIMWTGSMSPMLPRGTPALIVAILYDQKESVRLLLEKGADVESKDSDGNPALISALEKSPDMVKLLLEKGASANTMTSTGIAALILAIQNDQSESVRLLLEKGADTSSKDWNGDAALILAIKKSPDMVKLLLETGASANTISAGSMSLRLPRGTPALIVAILYGQKESVRLLLEKGADVESKDSDGNPALILAIKESPDMVKLLLEKGESANTISSDRIPALILAIQNDQSKSVRLLLEKGADANTKDSQGTPILVLLALSRNKSRVSAEFLISRGAERDVEVGEKCRVPA